MLARNALILVFVSVLANAFVGDPTDCKKCHEPQYKFWREQQVQHSAAYLTLYRKMDHVNPECIVCHTLGYKSGGFDKILKPLPGQDIEVLMKKIFGTDKEAPLEKLHKKYFEEIDALYTAKKITKNFMGVQCEHCHGDREGHPAKKVSTKPRTATTRCTQCHRQPNAEPVTDAMKKKISCPLMK